MSKSLPFDLNIVVGFNIFLKEYGKHIIDFVLRVTRINRS